MTICASCHRQLRRDPIYIGGSAFGPKCAFSITGAKHKRAALIDRKRAKPDERQTDLFAEVRT